MSGVNDFRELGLVINEGLDKYLFYNDNTFYSKNHIVKIISSNNVLLFYKSNIDKNKGHNPLTDNGTYWNKINIEGGGSVVDNKNFLSYERIDNFLYKATFDKIESYDPNIKTTIGGCSSFVKYKMLYRNYDWYYDNTAFFQVITKDFDGMAVIHGMNDGELDNHKISQLPYHIKDGVNKNGIMLSTHACYNDWEYEGCGEKTNDISLLPKLILENIKTINDLSTNETINNFLSNVKINDNLQQQNYLLQFLITDGTTTYAILPPTQKDLQYVIVDITNNPKLTNFRWIDKKIIENRNDSDLQTTPNGIERWNKIEETSKTSDLRFTKCYETNEYLSEFIGINNTTKASTNEELEAIYNITHSKYQTKTRNGELWQTCYSVVYSRNGINSLYSQENWSKSYVINIDDIFNLLLN